MTKLDPRPAKELTSREHAKILCGLLGGMAFNAEAKDLRNALRYVLDVTRRPEAANETVETVAPLWVYSTLSGLVSCLVGSFGATAAFEALEWVLEKDEIWSHMDATARKTRKALDGKSGEQVLRVVDELRQELE